MGRIRTIKPEFFRSRSLARCTRDARTTFQGMWCEADDFGRGVADPRLIKGAVWPLDDDITVEDIEVFLEQLESTGHVRIYCVDNEKYYEVCAWAAHQAAAYRRGVAQYPEPPDQGEQGLHDQSCKKVRDARSEVLEGKGREGKGSASAAAQHDAQRNVSDDFSATWFFYPKKLDRGRALRSYTARRKAGATKEDLLSATKNYATAVAGKDPTFTKHGSTFYGPDEPYLDYVAGVPDAQRNGTHWVEPDVAKF